MEKWLLAPPITFIIVFLAAWLVMRLFSRLAYRSKREPNGSRESYACGEKNYDNTVHPDYSNFFPFAFFFTLAHVATLIMTTVPVAALATLLMAGIYILGAILGLYILFRS